MTIEERVNEGIKCAMKAQDKVRLETMRNIKKVILEAKTKPGAGDGIGPQILKGTNACALGGRVIYDDFF